MVKAHLVLRGLFKLMSQKVLKGIVVFPEHTHIPTTCVVCFLLCVVIPFFHIPTSLIEAVSVQHEWSGSSPPAALEFTTYGQVFGMKTSDKLTTLARYFCTRHFPHLHVHKRVCVCVWGCTHTHTVHLQSVQQ